MQSACNRHAIGIPAATNGARDRMRGEARCGQAALCAPSARPRRPLLQARPGWRARVEATRPPRRGGGRRRAEAGGGGVRTFIISFCMFCIAADTSLTLVSRFIIFITSVLDLTVPVSFCWAAGVGTRAWDAGIARGRRDVATVTIGAVRLGERGPRWVSTARAGGRGPRWALVGARAARGDQHAPSWFSICMTTEFICAFEVCKRVTAFRARQISFASSLALAVSPRLAASLMDFLVFCSSRWIPAAAATRADRATIGSRSRSDRAITRRGGWHAARRARSMCRRGRAPRICRSSTRCSDRISDFHLRTVAFGSPSPNSACMVRTRLSPNPPPASLAGAGPHERLRKPLLSQYTYWLWSGCGTSPLLSM